jgi:hypothetical protein
LNPLRTFGKSFAICRRSQGHSDEDQSSQIANIGEAKGGISGIRLHGDLRLVMEF